MIVISTMPLCLLRFRMLAGSLALIDVLAHADIVFLHILSTRTSLMDGGS